MIPQNPWADESRELKDREMNAGYGWDECFDTLKQWLFEPCTEHPCKQILINGIPYCPPHYQCPECMKELSDENESV